MTDQNECLSNKEICKMRCCKRVHLQIITPDIGRLFDYLNMHKNIRVIKKGGTNLLEIKTLCRHLLENGECAIWDNRPGICRDAYVNGERIVYYPGCIYAIPGCEYFDLWDD